MKKTEMNADEKRKVFEELLERYQDYIESEFSYEDGEREAERKAWLNKYDGIKEPLIKDEKIRKAVRAWADAWEFDRVYAYEDDHTNTTRFENGNAGVGVEIDNTKIEPLNKRKCYTIAELCGKEEE